MTGTRVAVEWKGCVTSKFLEAAKLRGRRGVISVYTCASRGLHTSPGTSAREVDADRPLSLITLG